MATNPNRNSQYKARRLEARKKTRAANRVFYESNCVICQEVFTHEKLTAMYCGQKCRNKARSYPAKFLEAMYKKAMGTLTRFERAPEEALQEIRSRSLDTQQEIADMIKAVGGTAFDVVALQEQGRQMVAKHRLQQQIKEQNRDDVVINQDPRVMVDPEMMKLRDELHTASSTTVSSFIPADAPAHQNLPPIPDPNFDLPSEPIDLSDIFDKQGGRKSPALQEEQEKQEKQKPKVYKLSGFRRRS